MWFGSFPAIRFGLFISHWQPQLKVRLNQEVATSPKTEMVVSTRQSKWRCRGECQSLKPLTAFSLWWNKRQNTRQNRVRKSPCQLLGKTPRQLAPSSSTRCDECIRAHAKAREERNKRQSLTEKIQRWRVRIGIPETKRCTVMWLCQGQCQSTKPTAQFQRWRKKAGSTEPTNSTRCDACLEARMKERVDM